MLLEIFELPSKSKDSYIIKGSRQLQHPVASGAFAKYDSECGDDVWYDGMDTLSHDKLFLPRYANPSKAPLSGCRDLWSGFR